MPEILMVAAVATLFFLLKYQQIRFFVKHLRRSFFNLQKPGFRGDPYRCNPEVERDHYREVALELALELQSTRDELQGTRMERDLAIQDRDLRVLKGRAKLGGAFVLGAITCFTSVNIAPQMASDLLAERPTHTRPRTTRGERPAPRDDLMIGLLTMSQRYYPYTVCAPDTCCHRSRLGLSDIGELMLRFEPAPSPIQFFWMRSPEMTEVIRTSGGEMPPTRPQSPQPVWIERYALPSNREYADWAPPAAITMTLD